MIKGSKALDLFDESKMSLDDSETLGEAEKQVLESQLLSGGLSLEKFAYFDKEKLTLMKEYAERGIGNEALVAKLEEAQRKKVSGEEFLDENDKFLHQVIHCGRNNNTDLLCEALQLALKKKGGLVAGYCNTGQSEGMILTRAAFAVMVKF